LIDADLAARRILSDIPTPPRAMTKLFEAACVAKPSPALGETSEVSAHLTRFGRRANRIVNLTLIS
jgi:hypothetical protein